MFETRDPVRARLTPAEAASRRARVIGIIEALPGATRTEHGRHLALEVRGRRWGWYLEDHHGDGRLAVDCKAPPGSDESLSARAPDMFHVPKYVGHHGWVGLWLDLPRVDWPEVEAALVQAYRMAAPKSLLARLRGAGTARPRLR
ncbi:MAG: MmcQ/YjbR family DNA-binding protein [Planctomycetota bacterium]